MSNLSHSSIFFGLSWGFIFILTSCGNPAQFRSAGANFVIESPKSTREDDQVALIEAYRYDLILAQGKTVIRPGTIPAHPKVMRNEDQTPLVGTDAEAWSVQLRIAQEDRIPGPLQERPLDLSAYAGLIPIEAIFTHSSGRNGQVTRAIFVDGEAPRLNLLEQSLTPAGDQRTLYWSASDNYQLLSERSTLYACLNNEPNFLPSDYEALKNLPKHCALVLSGNELHKASDQLTLGALTIEGTSYLPSQLLHYLYAEDSVGQITVIPMTAAPKNAGILSLDSSIKGVRYTKESSITVPLTLALIQGEQVTRVHQAPNSWGGFTFQSERLSDKFTSSSDFEATKSLALGSEEGLYSLVMQAHEKVSGLSSNLRSLQVVLDRTPPQVGDLQIQVPLGLLETTTQVTINWSASDLNGISTQRLEYQSKGESSWTKLADLNGVERSLTLSWGNRPLKTFSVRVVATDLAGNEGEGVSAPWSPQIFNAAVLTSSVQCFYCHLKVEGDVAGINFTSDIEASSGDRFEIIGKLFASNQIPQVFKTKIAESKMKVSGGVVENYDNSGIKIFPSKKDAAGVPIFPTLTVEQLTPRMNGTVTDASGRRYSRIYEGNLVLSGTEANPIGISGEFLVNGDLVIKGVYKGIGSIYARNVYVVGDLISSDCLPGSPNCPYPFVGTTDEEKLAKAKAAVKAKRSALYLAGIKQTVVGGVSRHWGDQISLSDPYSWLPESEYIKLCTPASHLRQSNGSIFPIDNAYIDPIATATDIRIRCEVGRVDAFLYGHDAIAWRSYANFLINGGFVGYKAALLSTTPYRWFHHTNKSLAVPNNPRNGMPANLNVIRYDWRLRAGGAGFESLKLLFE